MATQAEVEAAFNTTFGGEWKMLAVKERCPKHKMHLWRIADITNRQVYCCNPPRGWAIGFGLFRNKWSPGSDRHIPNSTLFDHHPELLGAQAGAQPAPVAAPAKARNPCNVLRGTVAASEAAVVPAANGRAPDTVLQQLGMTAERYDTMVRYVKRTLTTWPECKETGEALYLGTNLPGTQLSWRCKHHD